jgi:8-oxo-dGTP diphosphatase
MKTAVAIIALQGGQVLLVRNAKRNGSCEIPGGALLPSESVFGAAIRELFEETGLRVEPDDLTRFDEKDAHGWHVHILRALRWSGELRAGSDASDCWFGPPDLILEGQRSEDYETVMRAMCWHKVAGGR